MFGTQAGLTISKRSVSKLAIELRLLIVLSLKTVKLDNKKKGLQNNHLSITGSIKHFILKTNYLLLNKFQRLL